MYSYFTLQVWFCTLSISKTPSDATGRIVWVSTAAGLVQGCRVLWMAADKRDLFPSVWPSDSLDMDVKHLLVHCCTYHVGYITTIPDPMSAATLCMKHNTKLGGVHYIKITFFQGHWRHLAVPCISGYIQDIYLIITCVWVCLVT